jgi:hypothetical protein
MVRVGESDNGLTRVFSGVAPGAHVATGDLKDLYDGAVVVN